MAEVAVPMLKLLAGGVGGRGTTDGTGADARFDSPWGVASDGAGNLFVSDYYSNTLRKVVIATGTVTTLAGSPGVSGSSDGTGSTARFNLPEGVASDGAGNLFVADSGNHTIRKVVVATGAVTTLAGFPGGSGSSDGTGAAARFNSPRGLASDGAGNLFVADSGNHTIRKVVLATGAVTTLAGFPGGSGSSDGAGPAARFYSPRGIASDGTGNLFVSDYGDNTIRKVVIASGSVTTLAGTSPSMGSADGTGADARFYSPLGVACDGAGSLFVVDHWNNTIRRVVIAAGTVTTLAGSAGQTGSSDGTGTDARFSLPTGVASDGVGNLFVADASADDRGRSSPISCTIRKVVIATGAVTTLAGSPEGSGGTDGTGTSARFSSPSGVASDGAGNLFVADSYNHTIRKVVIATGLVTTLAGTAGNAGNTDGTGPAARFYYPSGIASDGAGNLFVLDADNYPVEHRTLRKVVVATGTVTTFAGVPAYSASVDGTGAAARFCDLHGLTSDGAGNLFVADCRTIRKVVIATGEVTTLAGSPLSSASVDGSGADARFCQPRSVASDGAGNLFIADCYTIRKLVIATAAVTTLAGSVPSMDGTDGTGAAAQFGLLQGMVSDRVGNLFAADAGNHTIRKVVIATGVVTTVVGSPDHAEITPGPLPAGLDSPNGLALGPKGEVYITDKNALLVAQF